MSTDQPTTTEAQFLLGCFVKISVTLLVVSIAAYLWTFHATPISERKANRLLVGMSRKEVTEILGKPTDGDPAQWSYFYPGSRLYFEVYFAKDGRTLDWGWNPE